MSAVFFCLIVLVPACSPFFLIRQHHLLKNDSGPAIAIFLRHLGVLEIGIL